MDIGHFEKVLWQAKLAGDIAANQEVERIAKLKKKDGSLSLDSGHASIILKIDGRSGEARKLKSLTLPYLSVMNVSNQRGVKYSLSLRYDLNLVEGVSGQELWIYQAACEAALPIVLKGLNVHGYVAIHV
ncbi:hypothetical protein [Vibrio parahaemolyticus]|uniref:hypothetical protein n=1 Tax=Vibrio parahaemolyticus TaxID=670 RepID=UPI002362B8F6|nr:hypothetical protein [Vibrio parahaemolyticus]